MALDSFNSEDLPGFERYSVKIYHHTKKLMIFAIYFKDTNKSIYLKNDELRITNKPYFFALASSNIIV